jgi:hypothetical protein
MSKSLFIRCSQETYELAHALAKKESRSLNKQIIHMIHTLADDKGLSLKQMSEVNRLMKESKEAVGVKEDTAEQEGKQIYSGSLTSESLSGLTRLAETKKQDFRD